MRDVPDLTVVPVTSVKAHCDPGGWPWARANRAAIDAHWAQVMSAQAAAFNGPVLVRTRQALDASGALDVSYVETDYASFVHARDLGWPDPDVGNCFAMAALRAADGPYVLGIMGGHTSNPGRIYFAAGTPDPGDRASDGTVDLAGSALRELAEETGIAAADVTAGGWHVVRDGARTAVMREITAGLPAAALKARIDAFLAAEADPELAGVRIVASLADLDDTLMPPFQTAYLRWALTG